MGLDSSQACINFCFGYSVFLEAHLQAIINSLECWQNIQTCRQAGDDTTLGKSSGSRPNSEQGEGEREQSVQEQAGESGCFSPLPLYPHPITHTDRREGSGPPSRPRLTLSVLCPQTSPVSASAGVLREVRDLRKFLLGHLLVWPSGRE